MKTFKIEPLNYKAELNVEKNPHLAHLYFGDKEKAWDMVDLLREQRYGEFCVIEVEEENEDRK